MPRRTVTASALYAILDREFRRTRSPDCVRCYTPLPFYRDPPDDVSANWDIGTPDECPHHCRRVIAEVVARLWTEYELAPRSTPPSAAAAS
jgi:hypothetical protein